MDAETKEYFDALESDLRGKKDRSAEIDELFQLSFLGDAETKERVSWCVAKMGQNKYPDMRIVDILLPLTADRNPQVRENVAWGIGEVATAGIGDDRCVNAVVELMGDRESSVRGMAAWAAGRLVHKLSFRDEILIETVKSLLDDRSKFVRKSAEFALGDENGAVGGN